jgi:N-acyl-phosphatidylethanolamine-hydrolysing phospholipase D
MDWWDVTDHAGIRVRAVPAQHFSARSVSDRNFTLWCGFVLETALGNIYFAGDTGYGPFISDIVKRYDSFICALIPIGAYEPTWMMRPMHTDPHEALLMHEALHIQTSIGIHHGTFRLTDEPQYEPKARIERERGVRDFRAVENGATVLIKGRVSKNS